MITQTAKYAFRTLAYLAQQEGDTFLQARYLAQRLHIPAGYLGKLLQQISRAGLVDSRKGRHGGFRSIRPADQIKLYDVLRALDGIPRDAGLDKSSVFDNPLPPTFFDCFESIARLYSDFLKMTTLADMMASPDAKSAAKTEAIELRWRVTRVGLSQKHQEQNCQYNAAPRWRMTCSGGYAEADTETEATALLNQAMMRCRLKSPVKQ